MLSLQQQQQQQQQKPADLLAACSSSWKFEHLSLSEEHTPLAPLFNSSLNCALEKSMKVWQPPSGANGASVGGISMMVGDADRNCLGNALRMTWLDWTKSANLTAAGQGCSDDLSISSGASGSSRGEMSASSGSGGSRGASRTPSPFGFPPSSSISAPSHALPPTLPPVSHTLPPPPVSHTLPPPPPPPVSHSHSGSHASQVGNGFGLGQSVGAASVGAASVGAGAVAAAAAGPDIPMKPPGGQNGLLRGGAGANEVYSRKVFVGGLPPDIDQDEIKEHFIRFGPLTVDWPHKAQSKAYFPPKGYAFLLFRDEVAVHRLVKVCVPEEGKLFMFVSSVTQTHKKVQIRPWKLSDSDFIMDHTQPIDPRKTIFIGGVPRPLKAAELADIFNSRYGNVCYAGIDCDPELKYPKGAGRVTFSSRVSFMSAVSCRFLQVTYGDIDKKVEVKPYVLDDQVCDECQGLHCGGRYAPYFCGNIHCLRYYCEHCWAAIHSAPGTQNHRCFIKENGDRPRAINFFPSQPRVMLP